MLHCISNELAAAICCKHLLLVCQPGLLLQESRRVEGEMQRTRDHLGVEACASQLNVAVSHKRPADTVSEIDEEDRLHLDKKIKVEV